MRLNVLDCNERAIRCNKAVGFKEIGHIREGWYYSGRYHDAILMDILDIDFYSKLR